MNNWEKELTGETNVFWKVINKRITPETQQFIHLFISSLLSKQREEILGKVADLVEFYPTQFQGKLFMLPVGWSKEIANEIRNLALSDIEK